ncbi:hypothetical protein JKP88DRAFT_304888 [Tribonema minus]|uniref:Uncharacterized protein n=1 Tax=Tribonema minus TaxID=303371 RepID=A0A835Z714_9STRA|nr:hypothetical protein JKP88DRAFT_304888 [Tribonema minus]
MDTDTLEQLAQAEMERVVAAVDRMKEDNAIFEVIHADGKVSIDLGPKIGTYQIRFVHDLRVLQLSSPRSGGFMYVYDEKTRKWLGREDAHDFEGMLTRDLIQQANGYPDF